MSRRRYYQPVRPPRHCRLTTSAHPCPPEATLYLDAEAALNYVQQAHRPPSTLNSRQRAAQPNSKSISVVRAAHSVQQCHLYWLHPRSRADIFASRRDTRQVQRIPSDRILVHGLSMGGAAASALGANHAGIKVSLSQRGGSCAGYTLASTHLPVTTREPKEERFPSP